MIVSIIVPTLNEAANLTNLLSDLGATITDSREVEIIVCDGGSLDDTCRRAREFAVTLLQTPPGRAHQMNHGAARASGDWLLFLHADTRLPPGWKTLIENCRSDWGRFDVRLAGGHPALRLVEKTMNLRSRWTSVATGDQAMFFKREFFYRLHGFPPIPLMEDIALSKRARQQSRPYCIDQPVLTSSRRWEHNGILRTIMQMWWLRLAYWVGVSPRRLHRWYYPQA